MPLTASLAALLASPWLAPLQDPAAPDGIGRSPLRALRPDAALAGPFEDDGFAPAGTEVEIPLEEFVRAVLERNLALKLAEVGNAQTAAGVMEALGAFDPELFAALSLTDREQPTAFTFQADKSRSVNGSAGLRGRHRSGLAYDLTYSLVHNRQSTTPGFSLNPTLSDDLTVRITQPLLRGAGTLVNEAPVEQARLLVARGDLDLHAQVQQTAFGAIEAYWGLVRARRERDTARTALEVAEELVRNNERRRDAGAMTRIDVLTAQAEAARRREALIRAENAVGRAEDALKILLSPGARLEDWGFRLVPVSEPAIRDEALPEVEDAVLAAYRERTDLHALEVDLRAADLDLRVAEDQEESRLDLTGSYGFAGLSGESPGGSTKSSVELVQDGVDQIVRRDFNTWSVGFDYSRPIGNRAAEAVVRRARLAKEGAYMAWLSRRMEVVREILAALRDVADAKAAAEAATQSRVLAQEQYQAELVRLENQHSTTFQVREAQRDLFEAEDRETAAITQYEIQRAAFERARGGLAERFGVRWEPVGRREGELLE